MGDNSAPLPAEVHGDIRLARLEAACQALEEATSIPEVKDIRDKAEAIALYFRQQRGSYEAAAKALELKLRAERKLGALLEELSPHGGDRKSSDHDDHLIRKTLKDLHINTGQNMRWRLSAKLPEESFEHYLAETISARREPTSADVYRLAKAYEREAVHAAWDARPQETSIISQLGELIQAGKRFGTIYADPPWRYGNQATRASTDKHYQTMTVEEIAAMPVKQIAEDDAHLHLWTTNGFLFEAKEVIEAWGFEYKSCFVWVKSKMGIGNYWRVSHEFLLFGVRGNCPFRDHSLISWFQSDRTVHSRKPERVRYFIEKASPPAYVELFGRRAVNGWTVLGNEVDVRQTPISNKHLTRMTQGTLKPEREK